MFKSGKIASLFTAIAFLAVSAPASFAAIPGEVSLQKDKAQYETFAKKGKKSKRKKKIT